VLYRTFDVWEEAMAHSAPANKEKTTLWFPVTCASILLVLLVLASVGVIGHPVG